MASLEREVRKVLEKVLHDMGILREVEKVLDMASSVREVEKILEYKFKRVELLEEALTHPSCTNSSSNYERLEFVGDAALGLAVSKNLFSTYPDLDQGELTLLRAVNVSNEKLARAAVKHGLHRYVRHSADSLRQTVTDFALEVEKEDGIEVHGGAIPAPKILADIVESVAAAVFVDCGFDLKVSLPIFERLLKPLVTLDLLRQQPQPVTMLFQFCQKNGKQINIATSRKGNNSIAKVFVDGKLVASASSKQKESAKISAAKDALKKLGYKMNTDFSEHNGSTEIECARHKLYVLCRKKKWSKPIYRTERVTGPAHDRRFICSVRIETIETFTIGEEKSRIKKAENSAASMMLLSLREYK